MAEHAVGAGEDGGVALLVVREGAVEAVGGHGDGGGGFIAEGGEGLEEGAGLGRWEVDEGEVDAAGDIEEHLNAGGGVEVEREGAFAGVEGEVEGAAVEVGEVAGEGRGTADLAAGRGLDLDDVGAEVGKGLRSASGGDGAADLDDADAGVGLAHVGRDDKGGGPHG